MNAKNNVPTIILIAIAGLVALLLAYGVLVIGSDTSEISNSQAAIAANAQEQTQAIEKERSQIKKEQCQAVFLNSADGQVYYGKITDLNTESITIEDIYYTRVEGEDQSLAKLGSEIHGPEDKMVINKDGVLFWENLKDDGQVVQAIKNYQNQ